MRRNRVVMLLIMLICAILSLTIVNVCADLFVTSNMSISEPKECQVQYLGGSFSVNDCLYEDEEVYKVGEMYEALEYDIEYRGKDVLEVYTIGDIAYSSVKSHALNDTVEYIRFTYSAITLVVIIILTAIAFGICAIVDKISEYRKERKRYSYGKI